MIRFLLGRRHTDAGDETPLKCLFGDASALSLAARRHLGVLPVEIQRIVGSVGRCRELDRSFRELARRGGDRYRSVRDAMQRGEPLPAVELYKVGEEYYILDGHHRVAAARELGREFLDAEVTEFRPRGSPIELAAPDSRPAGGPAPRRQNTLIARALAIFGHRRPAVRDCPFLLAGHDGRTGCGHPERLQPGS